ncbi:MAG: hypothetical protein K5989_10175 [Lachnospiraceae bacterium]|nr:hypothetical protein [Lachnospiraceae bacterium]
MGQFLGDEEVNELIRKIKMAIRRLGGFNPGKEIEDYSLKELVWDRAEYDI